MSETEEEKTAKEPFGMRVEIEGLEKRFGNRWVLKNMNLSVYPGEFVAVVGRSGCGKSTLLRLIAGLETLTGGTIKRDGKPVLGLNPEARVMFQDSRLLPWQKVADNVALGVTGRVSDVRKQAYRALNAVGLAAYAEEWPAVLSGGQRQRVALARALICRPRLLLLDEPLGALDALTRIEMQQLVEKLWQKQRFTSLLVTHDVEEAVALADRIVLLQEGKVAFHMDIPLARPRRRNSTQFAKFAAQILERVMEA